MKRYIFLLTSLLLLSCAGNKIQVYRYDKDFRPGAYPRVYIYGFDAHHHHEHNEHMEEVHEHGPADEVKEQLSLELGLRGFQIIDSPNGADLTIHVYVSDKPTDTPYRGMSKPPKAPAGLVVDVLFTQTGTLAWRAATAVPVGLKKETLGPMKFTVMEIMDRFAPL